MSQQKCEKCVRSMEGCTVTATFSEEEFTPEAIKPFNCQGTINQMNIQHGPNGSYVSSQVQVCQTAYPGCSINFNDFSCLTFQNQDEARTFIDQVQNRLRKPVSVQLCGSRSVNVSPGCDAIRQTTKYSISPTEVREELGPCPAPGTLCTVDVGLSNQKTYQCLESGVVWNQECCLLSTKVESDPESIVRHGVWGPLGGGCLFKQCDEDSCPLTLSCNGTRVSGQACVDVEGSTGKASACYQLVTDCADSKLQCTYQGDGLLKCGEECNSQKCPTVSRCEGNKVFREGCSQPSQLSQGVPACVKTSEVCDRSENMECRVEDGEAACRPILCNDETCPPDPKCLSGDHGTFQYCDLSASPIACTTFHEYCEGNKRCKVIDGDVACVAQPTPTGTPRR